MAELSSSQQKQLSEAKTKLIGLKTQVDAMAAAEKKKQSSGNVVGGGSSDALRNMSIALAQGKALPKGVKQDVFDSKGNRTGKTRDVGGKVVSTRSATLDPTVRSMLEAEDAVAALSGGSTKSTTVEETRGSVLSPTAANPFAVGSASWAIPAFDQTRYAENADFFKKMFDPGATANTTSMYGSNKEGQFRNSKFGGDTISQGGAGGPTTWGDGSGQYTPGISGDGQALTATRNLGVGSPAPTSKPQANAAGVPDTGGQSAANATTAGAGDSLLKKTMNQLIVALTAQRDMLQSQLVGTADPVDNAVANIDNALSKAYESALADLPDYAKMKEDAKSLFDLKADIIDDRRDALEDRYREDKAAIKSDFATQKDELGEKQKTQTGQLAGGLASTGAYLGFDNVNHSAMLSLQVTHDREMTVLGQGKIAALAEARRAFEDSDFALMTEHVNAIEAYDKKITELANTHFTQTLQVTQEARANVKFMQDTEAFERDKGFDNLDAIIEAGTTPTEQDIRQYARTFGLSVEDVRGYIASKQKTKTKAEDRQQTADDIALAQLRLDIPLGTSVTINGKTVTGLKRPTAAAGSVEAGTNVVTAKDVFEKFGNDPIARTFIGRTTNELYTYFGQESIPDEATRQYLLEEAEQDGVEISTDPDTAEAQLMGGWESIRRGVLGYPMRTDIGDMGDDTLTAAITEINNDLLTITGNRAAIVTRQDVYADPNEYPREFLDSMAAKNAQRVAAEKEALKGSSNWLTSWLNGSEEEVQ